VVGSSNIASIGHDPETKTLEVEFRSGSVHRYEGVEPEHYSMLIHAPSIGSHFHKFIRDKFPSKKVS